MKKIIPFFIIGLLMLSCEIDYDMTKRLSTEGVIVDRNQNPIENIEVEWVISNDYDRDIMSYTQSNSEGYFEMIIPEPNNEFQLEVVFKESSSFQEKEYVNIFESNYTNNSLQLGSIMLFEPLDISRLEIELIQQNENHFITEIFLDGLIAESTIWFNSPEYQTLEYTSEFIRDVAKNQTVIANYSIQDQLTNETAHYQQPIIIGSEEVTNYSIIY